MSDDKQPENVIPLHDKVNDARFLSMLDGRKKISEEVHDMRTRMIEIFRASKPEDFPTIS